MNLEGRRTAIQSRIKKLEEAHFSYIDQKARQRAHTAIRLSMADYIPDDDIRRKVLGWLIVGNTCILSTSALQDAQAEAIKKWLSILPAENGAWSISGEAAGELRQLAEWMKQGQPEKLGPIVQAAIAAGGVVEGHKHGTKKKMYFEFE